MTDAEILATLIRHLNKHGTYAFGDDDEGDRQYERCLTLLDMFESALTRPPDRMLYESRVRGAMWCQSRDPAEVRDQTAGMPDPVFLAAASHLVSFPVPWDGEA